jgi:hypothetical protein
LPALSKPKIGIIIAGLLDLVGQQPISNNYFCISKMFVFNGKRRIVRKSLKRANVVGDFFALFGAETL